MHGSVVHFEFHADVKTREFYEKTFGWKFQDISIPNSGPYGMAITTEVDSAGMPKNVGAINGGVLSPAPGHEAPNTVLVLQVDDCELALKEAVANGAQALSTVNSVGQMGVYARIADPHGNVIGLWQPLVGLE